VVIGIPRVMALYRSAPLLLHYLRAAGVPDDHLVLSPSTSAALFAAGARWGVHDPCVPSKLVLSHVDWLLRQPERPIDVLFMPAMTHARIAVRGTADTASCPIVAACGHTSVAALRRERDVLAHRGAQRSDRGGRGIVALTPELCLVDRHRLEAQLLEAFGPLLGLSAAANREALAHGLRAQELFHERCRRRGAKVLADARSGRRAVALVLARPYHADPGVQHGISTELAARGLPVMGISSLPLDEPDDSMDISELLPESTNSGAAERVWAARRVTRDPHLVPVDLSSFRCGQDAAIAGLLDDLLCAADRPVLRLHDLDEDRPGASLALRVDTFVATVRAYEDERLASGKALARP
jgi:predicted nucleotide-binding protein (sugar kinase/HSP70/actin superfamily)